MIGATSTPAWAQFLLTEVAHGLDAFNLETTATVKDDGNFDLHTPNPGAAKYMPPTLPFGGVPRVGVVMARLVVNGVDKGIRPFVVALNDGKEMCKGVTARELPSKSGCRAVGHAITSFDHVAIPPSALLGKWTRTQLRGISTLGPSGGFILHSLAQGFVLEALYRRTAAWVSATPVENVNFRNAICAIVKATMIGHWRRTGVNVADRCSAQEIFDYNQFMHVESELRGVAIAEGDVLVLGLRLAPELSLAAILAAVRGEYRGARANELLLPRCLPFVEAIGHRMEFEAATNAGVSAPLVCLYELGAVGAGLAAYVEASGVEKYAVGAIVSQEAWDAFVGSLDVYRGSSSYAPFVDIKARL
ncbi:uncharacterized protein PHACADRAFT_198586 [Phanerochaete carnosa HHB-10118-sp]|uniref:Uncharacterized protein n=1 Tax=Phanerochaete carnosa (strain HHB-10118-sp) TaxID=650164 RepID=K5URK9_PHACS|nr:uncharacterized protein PHACADRAFT_198586 [Phanerochaete carnosa HHB-10118-sp]EKM52531.1 hypothetical protein PHACADRAFT_198586 [Phanerochaete carnosa HHB-10118-sp]